MRSFKCLIFFLYLAEIDIYTLSMLRNSSSSFVPSTPLIFSFSNCKDHQRRKNNITYYWVGLTKKVYAISWSDSIYSSDEHLTNYILHKIYNIKGNTESDLNYLNSLIEILHNDMIMSGWSDHNTIQCLQHSQTKPGNPQASLTQCDDWASVSCGS